MQRADFVPTFNYSKRCNETNSPLRVCINIVVQKNIILLYRRVTTAIFRNWFTFCDKCLFEKSTAAEMLSTT